MDNKEKARNLSAITGEQWDAIALLKPEYREAIFSASAEKRKLISSMSYAEWENILEGREELNLDSKRNSDYESLYIKVTEILNELNIDIKLSGYSYLREAVILMYYDSSYNNRSVTTRLYPEIAKKFNTSASNIERDIRYIIDYANHNSRKDIFYKYFPEYCKNKKLTNKHAISQLVKHIKLYQ